MTKDIETNLDVIEKSITWANQYGKNSSPCGDKCTNKP